MKSFIFKHIDRKSRVALLLLLLSGMVFTYCQEDPKLWELKADQQLITEYVMNNPDRFSEFGKLLESTGLDNLLSVRGPFTLLLPTNEAMQQFYKEKGVTSFDDFDDTLYRYRIVYNHLIANEIQTNDIGLGALRDTNALGDYLVSEFLGADIIINKQAKIIKRDIRTANGIIQLIDKVLEPVTINIYDLIKLNPSLSIFAKGLELTGLKDTLSMNSFPYGKKMARNRFTVLAVPDTTFQRYGINNVNDLVKYFTEDTNPDSLKSLYNAFYRYIEYHCLGGTYYLSDFNTRLYPILSYDNNISVTIANDYKLNLNKTTGAYTGFVLNYSNVPAKNGALHTVNDLLPIVQPEPTTVVFETTDYFDLKQGDYFGKYYMKWSDGQNTFKYIKWDGDYLQYYYKNHDTGELLNWDCLNMNGFWWIELTTPKVMKGTYAVSGNLWSGQLDYAVYIDGVKSAIIKRTDSGRPKMGTFTWNSTQSHKIKVVALSWGMLFWDTITFTPVK